MDTAPITARGTAPGKVILLGEHAVVYGRTALAAAINRHVDVRLVPAGSAQARIAARRDGGQRHEGSNRRGAPLILPLSPRGERGPSLPARLTHALTRAIELIGPLPRRCDVVIDSDLPVGVGLGSSAALSVALIRALADCAGRSLDDATLCAHAFELEKIFHGFPSGIDNTVATYGNLIAFQRGAASRPLTPARPIPLVIAVGRAPRETQQAVTALRQRWQAEPAHYEALFDEIDWLVDNAERGIASGDLQTLGGLMNVNQTLLSRLGVSTDELDALVALARAHGALGAKLTGGGGGGAVICLCAQDRERLVHAFASAGFEAFTADIGTPRGADARIDAIDVARHAAARV